MKKVTTLFWFVVFAMLLTVDIIVPDPIPLIDEILFAMVTGFFGYKYVRK